MADNTFAQQINYLHQAYTSLAAKIDAIEVEPAGDVDLTEIENDIAQL